MIRLAILGSTRGTNLDAIVEAISNKELDAKIEIVISNKSSAKILERASSYGLKTVFVDSQELSREQHERKISDLLEQYSIDLVVLIGYMRILSTEFISRWKNKIINVHPSLLPLHAGKMDMDVHRDVLIAGEKETGCSVHYVTEAVDAGPVIMQEKCLVAENDTAEILKSRVQEIEAKVLVKAIAKFILNK